LKIESSIVLLRADAVRESPAGGPALLERVLALSDAGAEAQINPMLKALAGLAAAEYQLRHGQTSSATRRIDAILRDNEPRQATPAVRMLLAVGKTLKGASLLQAGQPASALSWLTQGRDEMAALYGTQHPMTATYAVNSALALGALGRYKEARGVIEDAEPVLRQAMGAAAPNCRRIERWREQLRRAEREGLRSTSSRTS
jgi:hypothetical protein